MGSVHFKKKNILIIKSRAIGDTILLTGVLRVLRKNFPQFKIHVLVRAPAGELLEGLPYIDRIISAKEPRKKIDRLAYWMRLVRVLRAHPYVLTLNFHASFRSSLTAKFLRADKCIANHHELKGRNWFSDEVVPGRGVVKPVLERDLDLLRSIGIHATIDEVMPEVVLSKNEIATAQKWFHDLYAKHEFKGPKIFLGIGGSRLTKRWPAKYFAELAARLASEKGSSFVLSTIEIDRLWMEEFKTAIESFDQLKGKIFYFENQTLRKTAMILSQCDLYIGNDSGLKHLAIALGLKTFTFFGPEAPSEWHPYSFEDHPYAFIEDLPCRTHQGKHWCSIPTCHEYEHRCMQGLSPLFVWPAISKLVEKSKDHSIEEKK